MKVTTENNIKEQISNDINTILKEKCPDYEIKIIFSESNNNINISSNIKSLKNVKHIIAIASGKGGVGKSTTTVNLAAMLSKNLKVGILDLDIYGPSLPTALGINEMPVMNEQNLLSPINKYGMKLMSFGFLNNESAPTIWRGPMVSRMTEQFFEQVDWGELDILLLDLPPGTGDIQLTLVQKIALSGAIIVTTPQDLALLDVKRGIQMFDKTGVKILGLIDNMSYFKGDNGKKYPIFGESGVEKTAKEFNKKFLGHLPIHEDLRSSADKGEPLTHFNPDHEVSTLFKDIAKKIKESFQ